MSIGLKISVASSLLFTLWVVTLQAFVLQSRSSISPYNTRAPQSRLSTTEVNEDIIDDPFDDFLATNEPFRVSSSFKKDSAAIITKKMANLDITKLKPNDPRFLLVPMPKEDGPETKAYARHFMWKRQLRDSERTFGAFYTSFEN